MAGDCVRTRLVGQCSGVLRPRRREGLANIWPSPAIYATATSFWTAVIRQLFRECVCIGKDYSFDGESETLYAFTRFVER
jgi:hypothetical protein